VASYARCAIPRIPLTTRSSWLRPVFHSITSQSPSSTAFYCSAKQPDAHVCHSESVWPCTSSSRERGQADPCGDRRRKSSATSSVLFREGSNVTGTPAGVPHNRCHGPTKDVRCTFRPTPGCSTGHFTVHHCTGLTAPGAGALILRPGSLAAEEMRGHQGLVSGLVGSNPPTRRANSAACSDDACAVHQLHQIAAS
jgi:hypothetical protein